MFTRLAHFTTKYRIAIILLWLAAAIGLFLTSPSLSEVGITDESQFLPQDTESATAARLLSEKFISSPESSDGGGIIVIYNTGGLKDDDFVRAAAVHDWLMSGSAPAEIKAVTSIFENDALRARLISPDQTAMMMVLDFSTPPLSDDTGNAIERIRSFINHNYPDSDINLTGGSALFQDMLSSVRETVDRTTIVTIVLVIALLLLIYRSPIAILLPLAAIGVSFAVATGLLGYLGAAGAKFSTLAEAYLVVIIFGVGTDYCLFIISRYREELNALESRPALIQSLVHIGPVVAASALTVIVAFLSLGVSNFGMNQTMGYAMALGVAVTLLAGLTLVPALISLAGKYLFWPAKASAGQTRSSSFWQTIGDWVSRRPVLVAVPIIALLLFPYLVLPGLARSADIIDQLPQNSDSVKGYRTMASHFQVGELSPLYVLVQSDRGELTASEDLETIKDLADSLAAVPGVSRVDYYAAPTAQVSALSTRLRALGVSLLQGSGLTELSVLQSAGESLTSLALSYPGIVQSPNFIKAGDDLTKAGAYAAQLASASSESVPALLNRLIASVNQAADDLDIVSQEFQLLTDTPFSSYLLNTYFSADRHLARINVVLSGSTDSTAALKTVDAVRVAVKNGIESSPLAGSGYYVGGEDAVRADIMHVNDDDFGRVIALCIAGVLVVIVLLLRSVLAPLYMVATVLLNYGATLGIATWLFIDTMHQGSLIYLIPLLIFVILVALGADYNIFLVSRIREEARQYPIKEAVSRAVTNTGGVITACGIILAGTFATLMTSPLQVVFQIGAAVGIGVLIDTFLVRALLVPALAALAGRWSWWPSSLFRRKS